MSKTDFRKQIQDLKKQKGVSTAQIAREAGLSYFTVCNFLSGRSSMRQDNLAKIFDILNSRN